MVLRSRDVWARRAIFVFRRQRMSGARCPRGFRRQAIGVDAAKRLRGVVVPELQRTLTEREEGVRGRVKRANKQRDPHDSRWCLRDGREGRLAVLLMVAGTSQ